MLAALDPSTHEIMLATPACTHMTVAST